MPERVRIAAAADIPESGGRAFTVAGRRIAVFRSEGRFFAVDDTCTHADASLSEGAVCGGTVACPLHGAEFDLATGEALTPPAIEPVRAYPVFLTGDSIEVEV